MEKRFSIRRVVQRDLDRILEIEVASFGEGHTVMSGKPVGGMSFKLEVHAVDGLRHRAVLFARGPDGVPHQVTEREGPFATLDVRAFPLRDRAGHSTVVIELGYPLGDEGVSGELGEIGVCATSDCSFP